MSHNNDLYAFNFFPLRKHVMMRSLPTSRIHSPYVVHRITMMNNYLACGADIFLLQMLYNAAPTNYGGSKAKSEPYKHDFAKT